MSNTTEIVNPSKNKISIIFLLAAGTAPRPPGSHHFAPPAVEAACRPRAESRQHNTGIFRENLNIFPPLSTNCSIVRDTRCVFPSSEPLCLRTSVHFFVTVLSLTINRPRVPVKRCVCPGQHRITSTHDMVNSYNHCSAP